MAKHEITIIIPSVKPLGDSDIIPSYIRSGIAERVYIQFVYLRNWRKPDGDMNSRIEPHGTHEIMHVMNDRFFSTCEENMYRTQDFVEMFKPFVFLVGEHDAMDWAALETALDYRERLSLDVMGWNIFYKQKKADGGYTTNFGVVEIEDVSNHPALPYVKKMFEGNALDSALAYPAMISVYGPLDWSSYIGNHLYSRAAYARMLQYTFREAMYSHVYKQARLLTEYSMRYGFCNVPVVHRIADEFIDKTNGKEVWWNPEARTAMGNTANIWIECLLHLHEIEDDLLYDVLLNSICMTQIPDANGDIALGRFSTLNHGFNWIKDVVVRRLMKQSYYFPNERCNGSLQDILTAKLFFAKLLRAIEARPGVYHYVSTETRQMMTECLFLLSQFFAELEPDDNYIKRLGGAMVRTLGQFKEPHVLLQLNQASFQNYCIAKART